MPKPDPSTLIGIPLLEATDWSMLRHAHGCATDTPGHLLALIGDSEELRQTSLDHISTCMGQTMIWSASPVAALVILGFLLEPSHKQTIAPIRKELEAFILRVIKFGCFISHAEHTALMRHSDYAFELSQKQSMQLFELELMVMPYRLRFLIHLVSGCIRSKLIKLILNQSSLLEHPAFLFDIIYLLFKQKSPSSSPSDLFLSNPDTLFTPQLLSPHEHMITGKAIVPESPRKELPPDVLTPLEP